MQTHLKTDELKRYNRHIIMSEVTLSGQEKIKAARVLVIGAGGLGAPILQYLSAAGIGTIGIVDDDKVDLSNLQRQVLFRTSDIGKYKAEIAATQLSKLNPHTNWHVFTDRLTKLNAIDHISNFDVVVDGTDNFATRYLINDACVICKKPLVFGSIFKFEGQIAVFNYQDGPTYRCLFPEPPEDVPNCSQVGVLGVLPAIVGSYQANEVLKIVLGIGQVLSGKLMLIDVLQNTNVVLDVHPVAKNQQITTLDDYERYDTTCDISDIKSISVDELNEKETPYLLDVRDSFELEMATLNPQLHIPQNELGLRVAEIPRDKEVIVYCHFGQRSQEVIQLLQDEYGFTNLINLDGGIDDWAVEVDHTIDRY